MNYSIRFLRITMMYSQNILVGPPGGLEKFWETNINHPGMEGHPALVDLHKTLPLAMHGDGVPITGLGKIWSKTAWVYSWSSLLSDATTKDKQMFIGMVWDTLQGPNTMNTFHSILAWSFKHLQLGIWPSEDWERTKVPVQLYCVLYCDIVAGFKFCKIKYIYSNMHTFLLFNWFPGMLQELWSMQGVENN